MGALAYQMLASEQGMVYKGLLLYVADATAADTVTIAELDDITLTYCVRLDTNAAQTNTEATNVVTIGSGPSSTDLLLFVYGYKARS